MKRGLMWILSLLVLLVVAAAWFVYSGVYNVAASERHTPAVKWLLSTVREQSVEKRAQELTAPPLTAAMVERGSSVYRTHCEVCHGAPGISRGPVGEGLTPRPPDLSLTARLRTPEEIFWVVKHGIKMTGMPAWSSAYSDSDLWPVVAFVEQLSAISEEQYAQMGRVGEAAKSEGKEAKPEAETARGRGETEKDEHVVTMTNDLNFQPAKLTVEAGSTVTWRNTSNVVHTVAAAPKLANDKNHVMLPNGAQPFNSGNLEPGQTFSHTFNVCRRSMFQSAPRARDMSFSASTFSCSSFLFRTASWYMA